MSLPPLTRRRFLQLSSTSAVFLGLGAKFARADPPAVAPLSADDVRIAVIGLRIKGNQHADMLAKTPGAKLVALCDPDPTILGEARARLAAAGNRVDGHEDFRSVLDRKDIDAVVIATPNHWHTLMTLWALRAGKHAYVEKPVSHTLEESAVLGAAARKTGLVLQAGTQRRSDPGLREALAALHAGEFGRIRQVKGVCYRRRPSIGLTQQPAPVPTGLNLELFCGPAPLEVPIRQRFHYDWHWSWTMGNGEIGNQGPHELDICRWAINASGRPRRVLSLGGRFGPADNGETPNTHLTWFDFAEAPVLFEVRGLPRAPGSDAEDAHRGLRVGVAIDCEHGSLLVGNAGATLHDLEGKKVRRYEGDGGLKHLQNFVDAARRGRPDEITAPATEAVVSNDLVHFGNLAYRTGAITQNGEIASTLKTSPEALASFEKLVAHAKQFSSPNDVPVVWRMGGWLEWDEASQRFRGTPQAEAANQLRGTTYRPAWKLFDL